MTEIGNVVAIFEVTQDVLDRVAERDGEDARDEGLERAALGFYWQRYSARADGTSVVDAQAGPFPVYSAAFEAAALERANAGRQIEDWRDRQPADLAPVESTATVESDAHVVEAGPADGVVPLHDQDGTVLPEHEGPSDAPSATQEWPFEAQVAEGTGEPMTAVEVPVGETGVLEQTGLAETAEAREQIEQLPDGYHAEVDGVHAPDGHLLDVAELDALLADAEPDGDPDADAAAEAERAAYETAGAEADSDAAQEAADRAAAETSGE